MKKTYNHHLALYCANLSWRQERLKCRILRYLQRSVKGKSEYVTTKKALNKWRDEMSIEFKEDDRGSVKKHFDDWLEIIKSSNVQPVDILGLSLDKSTIKINPDDPFEFTVDFNKVNDDVEYNRSIRN